MASFDAIQNFNDTLDELRELCAISNEKHRDVFMKMANHFGNVFDKIETNHWKVSEEDVIALTEDLQQLVEKVKYANKLTP